MNSKAKLIWNRTRGFRGLYGAAAAALVLATGLLYLVPLVPLITLDAVLAEEPPPQGWMAWLVDAVGGQEFLRGRLWIPAALAVLLTALAGAFTYLRNRWAARATEGIVREIREELYDHLHHVPCRYHDLAETGDLVQRCTSDVETVRVFLQNQVVEIARAILLLIVPLPLMLALDWRMTLASTAVVPPLVLFSFTYFRRVKIHFQRVDEAEGRLTSSLQENLTGIRVVRAFARQEHEREKFAARNSEHRRLNYRLYRLFASFWAITDILSMGQSAMVVVLGGYWLSTGELQIGSYFFFLSAVNLFIWPVRMLGRILSELGKAMVAIGRIQEVLAQPRESAPSSGLRSVGSAAPPSVRRGEIVFDDVTFSYGEKPVLEGISFTVEPGQTAAILGPSGAGKSTLVNLLLRLYDPQAGHIRVDGHDIEELPRKEVRSRIAAVLQEPFLYSKTLRENIRFGRRDATNPEIEDAAFVACVHPTILEFDRGYETLVGERGITLSGGQRQRVALARALLDRPSILILDDALSAVDTETESLILQALRERRGQLTTLIIAHRLSTVEHADQVLVLDHGRVIQRGKPTELVGKEGFYRRVWRIQNDLEESLAEEIRGGGPGPLLGPQEEDPR